MENKEFKIGDVVHLKSDSNLLMTIDEIDQESCIVVYSHSGVLLTSRVNFCSIEKHKETPQRTFNNLLEDEMKRRDCEGKYEKPKNKIL